VSEENKALVQRSVEEAFNEGNLDVADEVYASDFVSHESAGPAERGPSTSNSSSACTAALSPTGAPPSRP
jgi:hypothetical protein